MKYKFEFYILFFIIYEKIETATVKIIDKNCPENKYRDYYYLQSYKIPLSKMSFIANGNYGRKNPLSYAFDGDINTFWKSNKYQSDSFFNNIEITFNETVSIDKMVYFPYKVNNTKIWGFPNELKIYYKLRNPDGSLNEDESFYLLVEDLILDTTGDEVLIIFEEEIICDQIKLEWVEIQTIESTSPSLAYASEIIFLVREKEFVINIWYF